MKTFLAIVGSFAAGFMIGKIYQAKKDEEYINDEVKQMREEYKQKMKELDKNKTPEEKNKETEEQVNMISQNVQNDNIMEYYETKPEDKSDYTPYSAISQGLKPEDNDGKPLFSQEMSDKSYILPTEEAFGAIPLWDCKTFYVHDNENIVSEDGEELSPTDIIDYFDMDYDELLTRFGKYPNNPEVLYFRNDAYRCDYEVLKDFDYQYDR